MCECVFMGFNAAVFSWANKFAFAIVVTRVVCVNLHTNTHTYLLHTNIAAAPPHSVSINTSPKRT